MRFILIDEIIEMIPGKSIHGVKTLRADEDVFRDHFPGFPVIPGVLLTEMMAQTAGKCLDAEDPDRGRAMLVQIRDAKFRRWVRPDQRVDIHGEIKSSAPSFASASCSVSVEGQPVASAELLFSFVPLGQFAADFRDHVLERYLGRHRDDTPTEPSR